MEHSQSLPEHSAEQAPASEGSPPELSALVAELADDYRAGRLSAEEAAEFEVIRERVASLEEKARARLADPEKKRNEGKS
jgi:hypothetical protein